MPSDDDFSDAELDDQLAQALENYAVGCFADGDAPATSSKRKRSKPKKTRKKRSRPTATPPSPRSGLGLEEPPKAKRRRRAAAAEPSSSPERSAERLSDHPSPTEDTPKLTSGLAAMADFLLESDDESDHAIEPIVVDATEELQRDDELARRGLEERKAAREAARSRGRPRSAAGGSAAAGPPPVGGASAAAAEGGAKKPPGSGAVMLSDRRMKTVLRDLAIEGLKGDAKWKLQAEKAQEHNLPLPRREHWPLGIYKAIAAKKKKRASTKRELDLSAGNLLQVRKPKERAPPPKQSRRQRDLESSQMRKVGRMRGNDLEVSADLIRSING